MDILIRGATVVTQDAKRSIMKGDIFIKQNKIERIGKTISEKAELVIDAKDRVAMPGLINMHTHVAMTLFRGFGEGLPLDRWLKEKIWPMEAKETGADAHVAAQLAMIEMIRSGTTAFNEMCLLGAKEIGKAAEEAGVRGHVCQGLFDLLPGRTMKGELAVMKDTAFPKSGLVTFGVGPHAVYTCSEELLRKSKEFAIKEKRKVHIHVSETRKEVFDTQKKTGKRTFEYLDSLGLVDSDSLFAHSSWVTKKEISLAGKKKLNVVHCPVSNLKLATGGICPVFEYDAAGANVCIGTDSVASNNSLNMFESMKLASLLQKHKYWKADIIPHSRILDFATRNGAQALGIDSGRIEQGALADIVLMKIGPNMTPMHDPVSNIIYAANPSNVTDMIINGRLVMVEGKIKTLDEEAVLARAEELSKEIQAR